MTPDGYYGETWLMVTPRRVVVFNPDHGSPQTYHFPLADLKQVEKLDFVGNGALRLVTHDRACEVRFTLSEEDKFTDVREVVEALREHAAAEAEGAANGHAKTVTQEMLRARAEARAKQKGRCPKCGRTLPRWSTVCPDCLQKAQLLLRLFPYLKPYWPYALLNLVLMFVLTGVSLARLPPKMLLDDVFPHRTCVCSLWCSGVVGLQPPQLCARRHALLHDDLAAAPSSLACAPSSISICTGFRSASDRAPASHQRIMSDTANLQTFIANGLQGIIST